MEGRKKAGDPVKEVQKVLLDMLIHIDELCKKNNIQYWLDAGSLLGSIRHQGFIPWDDDLDIGMLRKDYNKFKEMVGTCLSEKYQMETYKLFITSKHNYIKILYLDDFEWIDGNGKKHKGICIDIFPFDYVKEENRISLPAKIFNRLSRVLYHQKITNIKQAAALIINKAQVHNIYCAFNRKTSTVTYGIETPWYGDTFFEITDIFPFRTGQFEGYQFPIPNNADRYLKNLYGDYMIIPSDKDKEIHMESLQLTN